MHVQRLPIDFLMRRVQLIKMEGGRGRLRPMKNKIRFN